MHFSINLDRKQKSAYYPNMAHTVSHATYSFRFPMMRRYEPRTRRMIDACESRVRFSSSSGKSFYSAEARGLWLSPGGEPRDKGCRYSAVVLEDSRVFF